jgi:hypothetical protein
MITNKERIESILEDVDVNFKDFNQIADLETQLKWLCDYALKVESYLDLIDTSYNQTTKISYITGYMQALRDIKTDLGDIK